MNMMKYFAQSAHFFFRSFILLNLVFLPLSLNQIRVWMNWRINKKKKKKTAKNAKRGSKSKKRKRCVTSFIDWLSGRMIIYLFILLILLFRLLLLVCMYSNAYFACLHVPFNWRQQQQYLSRYQQTSVIKNRL